MTKPDYRNISRIAQLYRRQYELVRVLFYHRGDVKDGRSTLWDSLNEVVRLIGEGNYDEAEMLLEHVSEQLGRA